VTKILKVGIVGLGVGYKHFQTFLKHPNCKVIGISEFDKTKILKIKKKYPNIKFYEDAKKLISNKLLDLICIASYDNYHCDQILYSIKQKKHIFSEKPLCTNYYEYLKIKKALSKNKNIKLSSNLILRNSPQFLKLKNVLKKKYFSNIYYLTGEYNYGRLIKLTRGWRSQVQNYSVMNGGGIHMIDLIMWLLQKKPTKVVAIGNNISSKKTKFKYDDFTTALIKFNDGIIANVTANFGSVTDHHHTLSVFSKKGTFIQKYKNVSYRISRDKNEREKKIKFKYLNKDKSFVLNSFINSIIYNSKPTVSKIETLNSMAVSIAINKSLKTQKWEKIKF
jgi:predicted dehydrogenase